LKVDSIRLNRPLNEILKSRIHPYSFQVGVLTDSPHRSAGKGKKNFAGGPARTLGRKINGTLATVSKDVRNSTGVNYLTQPWKKKNDDAMKLMKNFFKLAFGENKLSHKKRVENLVQAIVRNPILRGTYGRNKKITEKIKGFNRKFIDTSQLFKGIRAKVKINAALGRGGK